ncbi:tryptophan halogenase family protein [Streptomyces tirandamycinicus]|uniref:tryptophan halogenase family protein n=1 Tax=Streptomyces tirandamycinicus TaxID=2174846 RepID=UPI00342951CE
MHGTHGRSDGTGGPGGGFAEEFRSFVASLPADDAGTLRRWLDEAPDAPAPGPAAGPDGGVPPAPDLEALFRDGESAPRDAGMDPTLRPRSDDPRAVRRIGVIGGGTAGYLTALALRAKRPWLEVTLVESSGIPIIGVGEATTPSMVPFLHHYLGIDAQELYEAVQPTWKLGIRFDWGARPEGFMAPFDWGSNSIGVLGSLATRDSINSFTLQSLLMEQDKVPVFDLGGGRHMSLMKRLPFAYHLDNQRFVRFLTELARKRGVGHLDARIERVVLDEETGWVDHLETDDGRRVDFDLYVDCSGFRSLLLGQAMGSPEVSFADSLFTDRAVTAVVPHDGTIKPYTRATTMDAGWCWTIPTRDDDHVGYVHSSRFISVEEATAELRRLYPRAHTFRTVHFRSGRHQEAWRGNVMAIGNSYAFVEPLESSGLMMITLGILSLVSSLPGSWSQPCPRQVVNAALAKKWDEIRWFLALHYRFNTRKDTPFWRTCREEADISGLEPLLEVFSGGAPLRFRDPVVRSFLESTAPTFYGLEGVDCLLLGQGHPTRLLPMTEPVQAWRQREEAAQVLVSHAVDAATALGSFDRDARLNTQLLENEDSWVVRTGTDRLVSADPDAPGAVRARGVADADAPGDVSDGTSGDASDDVSDGVSGRAEGREDGDGRGGGGGDGTAAQADAAAGSAGGGERAGGVR